MPVVDSIAPDYDGEVTFLAIAWKGSMEATAGRAAELMPSGQVQWALDESIFETYRVFGQPVTFAISADGVIVDSWGGIRDEGEIRETLDTIAGVAG